MEAISEREKNQLLKKFLAVENWKLFSRFFLVIYAGAAVWHLQ
jgi:hypothetical protein